MYGEVGGYIVLLSNVRAYIEVHGGMESWGLPGPSNAVPFLASIGYSPSTGGARRPISISF